ncbi:hypothetical protein NDU88_001421 [Pleurodeles waltl]|uniref:Uncharacterized protein n=1 Tax=Pleurodeles waltl TaxID=8319 RepID=A0AAV7KYK2_PLEWA|nr:hypothetical protein NDU88_001421 [Pleurodeles waltl]
MCYVPYRPKNPASKTDARSHVRAAITAPTAAIPPLLFAPGAAPARPGATRQPPLPSSLFLPPKNAARTSVCLQPQFTVIRFRQPCPAASYRAPVKRKRPSALRECRSPPYRRIQLPRRTLEVTFVMVSQAQVYEVQDDLEVKSRQTPLRFMKNRKNTLNIVTTQRSAETQTTTQDSEGRDTTQTLKNGISYTVWTVAGEEWELRLILSSNEVSSMLQKFNLIGFIDSLLVSDEMRDKLLPRSQLSKEAKRSTIKQICEIAEKCRGSSGAFAAIFKKKLNGLLTKKWDAHASLCFSGTGNLGAYLHVALVAVAAAVVARGMEDECEDSDSEEEENDDETGSTGVDGEKGCNIPPENIQQQFSELTQAFEVEEKLLCPEGGKKIYFVWKDNLQEGWCRSWTTAPEYTERKERFHYGIGHKILSVSGGDWEVQLLQSPQQNFNIYKTFNIYGFAESILMTKKGNTKLNLLINREANTEKINEVSRLAASFFCDKQSNREAFMKKFQLALSEKCEKYNRARCRMSGPVGKALFGTVLVLSASLLAKAVKGGDTAKGGETGTDGEARCESTCEVGGKSADKETKVGNKGKGSENGTDGEAKAGETVKVGGNFAKKETKGGDSETEGCSAGKEGTCGDIETEGSGAGKQGTCGDIETEGSGTGKQGTCGDTETEGCGAGKGTGEDIETEGSGAGKQGTCGDTETEGCGAGKGTGGDIETEGSGAGKQGTCGDTETEGSGACKGTGGDTETEGSGAGKEAIGRDTRKGNPTDKAEKLGDIGEGDEKSTGNNVGSEDIGEFDGKSTGKERQDGATAEGDENGTDREAKGRKTFKVDGSITPKE